MDGRAAALETLGLSDPISAQEIKKGYRKLSLLHHPDKNGNSVESNTKFRQITEAYNYLSKAPIPKMTYGQARGVNTRPRPGVVLIPPLVCAINLSLDKCYSGVMEPVLIERKVETDGVITMESEKIYIQIPEGIDDGEVITYKRKGHTRTGLGKGDLRVIIRMIPNRQFERQGLDLFYVQEMPLREALCGSSYELKHPSGRIIELKHSEGSVVSPSKERRVKNLGMKRGKYEGDLHIKFRITFPDRLSSQQVEKLKEVFEPP